MKTMNLPNSNNKLENNVFIHIAAAPDKPILESELPFHVQINEVVKTELSFQEIAAGIKTVQAKVFEADMLSFIRFELKEIPSILTYLSHGIDRQQFIEENKNLKQLAVYIYKKR